MDREWNGIDLAYLINGANVVNVPMSVNNVFRYQFVLLDRLQNTLCFVAGVDNDCFSCLGAGIQVTVLFKYSHGHAGDDWHIARVWLIFSHGPLFLRRP